MLTLGGDCRSTVSTNSTKTNTMSHPVTLKRAPRLQQTRRPPHSLLHPTKTKTTQKSLHQASMVESLRQAPRVKSLHQAPRVESLRQAPRVKSCWMACGANSTVGRMTISTSSVARIGIRTAHQTENSSPRRLSPSTSPSVASMHHTRRHAPLPTAARRVRRSKHRFPCFQQLCPARSSRLSGMPTPWASGIPPRLSS